jgi:hypothetical protein
MQPPGCSRIRSSFTAKLNHSKGEKVGKDGGRQNELAVDRQAGLIFTVELTYLEGNFWPMNTTLNSLSMQN